MGNPITEGIAKIAGNVTQSVISAVIIFLVTTYVLVGIGKKGGESSAAADSSRKAAAAKEAAAPTDLQRGTEPKSGSVSRQLPPSGSGATKQGTISTPVVTTPAGTSQKTSEQEAPARREENTVHKSKETPAEHPQRPPVTVKEAAAGAPAKTVDETPVMERTSRETVERQSTRDTAAVEKKAKDEVKKVKKHADEVFDELDQETGKNPPP